MVGGSSPLRRIFLQDYKKVMTCWHTAEEWKRFMEQGTVLQDKGRICVLCHRHYIPTVCHTVRQQGESTTNPINVHPKTLFQQYRNMVDTEGGYYSQHVLKNPASGWEGLVGALACYRMHKLVQTKRAGTSQWMLDQSAIVFKAPKHVTQPIIGENNQDFHSGAAYVPRA